MKALSVKQPWGELIASGIKDIENRTWKTKFRGRIYIHVGLSKKHMVYFTDEQLALASTVLKNAKSGKMSFGAIIGEVDIVDCVLNHKSVWAEHVEMPAGTYMGEKLIYNWVLENPVLYEKPILNVKGKLSLWDFNNKSK